MSECLVAEVETFLNKNKLYTEEMYLLPSSELAIRISGDWKHDHLRCDMLVKEFCKANDITIKDMSQDVVTEDGSDYYTADHYYRIVDKTR